MNLRKDHCRYLLSRTTREHVKTTTRRGETPCLLIKTRRGKRQGKLSGNKGTARHKDDPKNPNTQTTLGNGYLGSCIDEERSEMRYLV